MPPKVGSQAAAPHGARSKDVAALFEAERPRLRGLAYRMLGSLADADDVVQEAWLRFMRAEGRAGPGTGPGAGTDEPGAVANLPAWLTTITARLALDALQSRRRRSEEPLAPEGEAGPEASLAASAPSPEEEAILAEQVGLALLVVLDRLRLAERLAFVLHDAFGLPFEQVAAIPGRTPEAARQVASRAAARQGRAACAGPAPRPRGRRGLRAGGAGGRHGGAGASA